MKSVTILALLGILRSATAQTLAPSPTESVGCEPHGDHWHCEGPRTTEEPIASTATALSTTALSTTALSTEHDDHDDHDDDATGTVSGSLAPSPTESVGCEPHGDHWHCEGPAASTGSAETGFNTTAATDGTATSALQTEASASSTSAVVVNAAPGLPVGPVLGPVAGIAVIVVAMGL